MRQSLRLLACTLGAVLALPRDHSHSASWQPWGPGQAGGGPQALYTMTNDVSGNKVVAISVNTDGSLGALQYYSTGGVGGYYVSPVTGAPHYPDALSAQDAVVTAGDVCCIIGPKYVFKNTC